MQKDKKIVFVGYPNAGKTTINRVYFEKINPFYLLENPLLPSRGIDSTIYSISSSKLGIFDLAGQENELWFSDKGKDIFNESSVIICVFDVMSSSESIIKFLVNIYEIKNELHLYNCKIIAFLHKIDLISSNYLNYKLKTIKDFIINQHPSGKNFGIYKTSIAKSFFYDTFKVMSNVLNIIYKEELIPINQEEFMNLKRELLILLKFNPFIKYDLTSLSNKFKFNLKESKHHLQRLERFRFIKTYDDYQIFELTERAYYFKIGLENEIHYIEEQSLNRKVDFFNTFFCISEKAV